MENSHEWISRLIAKALSGSISSEEKLGLDEWLNKSENNQLLFKRIKSRIKKGEEKKSYHNYHEIIADWNKVEMKIRIKRRTPSFIRFGKYVAMLILFVSVAIGTWQTTVNKDNDEYLHSIAPSMTPTGSTKAILILSDGSSIELKDSLKSPIYQEGIRIMQKDSSLEYIPVSRDKQQNKEIQYNTIRVPRGGEYSLTLSDGTYVVLNSNSELRFPVHFSTEERSVYLKGEAFFEVKKNSRHPFVARTIHDVSVKVLGTRFNISAYEEDPFLATTLEEGSVELQVSSNKHLMLPNQQVILDTLSKKVSLKNVDARVYTAWRNGKFIFENETLESIMNKVSRWYDVDVFYKNDSVRHLRFSGDLEKYEDFSTALRMIENVTSIKISIKDKKVIIDVL